MAMNKNFLGNNIQWVWTMRKLNTPLSVSSYLEGVRMGQKVFGYPKHLSATWYDHGDIYFDAEEIKAIETFLQSAIEKNPAYPDKIAQHIFSLAKKIDRQALPPIHKKKLKELLATFKKEQQLFLEMIGFMSYRGSVQMGDVLREKIETIITYRLAKKGEPHALKKYIDVFSLPLYESIIAEEKKSALSLAAGFKKISKKAQRKRAQRYLSAYAWLSYHWFIGAPPSEKEIHARLMALSSSAKRELAKLKKEKKENEKTIDTAIAFLGMANHETRVLRQYRSWLFLRTYVKDNINKAGYKLLPLLSEIGKRIGIDPAIIPFLTLQEIRSLETLPIKEIKRRIEARRHGFSAGIVENTFSFQQFTGPIKKEPNHAFIRGAVAYKGIVTGVARVLFSPKEQREVQQGDILVTSMTTPDFLPAMERAAAFVTDEGGITCHAAIIAREMKKPCIIGTKTATKQLKNGDMIEVDAIQGIVKKIK